MSPKRKKVEFTKSMKYDVVVVGGGIGGVAAAVSAAQKGVKTLLIEQTGVLGGVATNCLNSHFSQRTLPGASKPTFLEECEKRLNNLNMLKGAEFNSDYLAIVLDEMIEESGCDCLFYTTMISATNDNRKVKEIRLHNKSGIFNVTAHTFIDSTGDGDLCYEAGAEFEEGDKNSNFGQPMTMLFIMSGINKNKLQSREEISQLYNEAKARGEIDNPRENVLFFESIEDGDYLFNTTRVVFHNATDGKQLSQAVIKGRKQVFEMVNFLEKLPGFEKAYLQRIASSIGVRESRRFLCDYRLTYEDMLSSKHFDDDILETSAHIDIHNPHGTGTCIEKLPAGTVYGVPLRCLIPKDLDNIIIGSRCFDASHKAFSAVRMMSHIGEYGRAAGFTAAKTVMNNCDVREVDVNWVQNELGTLHKSKTR